MTLAAISFPLVGPGGPLGVAEVAIGPRAGAEAALDWKAFFVDQVVQTWEGACGRRWPLGPEETFIWRTEASGPGLFGPSANLACLLAVARHVARPTAPLAAGRLGLIWATGKLGPGGELERVEAVKDKLRMFLGAARAAEGRVSVFFVPRANAADLEQLRRDGERFSEHVFEPGWTVPTTPGVPHVVAVRPADVAALVAWGLGRRRLDRRWLGAGIAALASVGVAAGFLAFKPARPCHGYDRPEPSGAFAASVEAKLTDAYARMGATGADLDAVRELFVRAADDAALERQQADGAAALCTAETHWASAVYYQGFVDYLALLACAEPDAHCDDTHRAALLGHANETLDGRLDYFLLNEAHELAKGHRRIALRDWLQIMIDLRFGGLESADVEARIATFIARHPCSDNQQGLLLLATLLAADRGATTDARALLGRALAQISAPPLISEPACAWFGDLNPERQATLIGGFAEIGMPEHRACYANRKPGQPAAPLLCAAYRALPVLASAELDARCRDVATDPEAERTIRTLRANLAGRRAGQPWRVTCAP